MILDYLMEKFYTADKYRTPYYNGWAEIYVNPSPREMRDIARAEENDEQSIRMAVDQAGNVYAWIYKILHDKMEQILGKKWILRFEYNYPEKEIWLGGGTLPAVWKKFGGEPMAEKLSRSIPGLHGIKFSDPGVTEDDYAWKKAEI